MYVCWGAFYSLWLDFSVLALTLDCEPQKCVSVFSSPNPLDGTECLEWAGAGYFPPSGQLDSLRPQQVGFCLTRFLQGQPCLEQSALAYFKTVPFHSFWWSMKGFFSNIYCENLVDDWNTTHNIVHLHFWVSLDLLTIRLVHTEPPIFVNYSPGFPAPLFISLWLLLVNLGSRNSPLPVASHLTYTGGSGLPCVLPSLKGQRRVDFSLCSAFSF